jgi:hypothetical protein
MNIIKNDTAGRIICSTAGNRHRQRFPNYSGGNDKEGNLLKNEITITGQGRVISKHASGVICAYDSRHRILKVPLEGGVIAELVQERTGSDTIYGQYCNQLLTVKNGRDGSVVEL